MGYTVLCCSQRLEISRKVTQNNREKGISDMFENNKPHASRSIMERYVIFASLSSIILWDGFNVLIHGLWHTDT